MLTQLQKQEFYRNGFIKVAGVVPRLMVDAARQAINHSIGSIGKHQADEGKYLAPAFCNELKESLTLTDLFNKTPVMQVAEALMGTDNVLPCSGAQIALRFPSQLRSEAAKPGGHLDGLGSGSNSMAKGVYRRGFTIFAIVYLSDVPNENFGNFTVWPESHRFFEDYFKKEEHQVLANGMPRLDLPCEAIQVTGEAGDLIVAHHQSVHCGGPNISADVRYAAIARLRHVECSENGYKAYTDIWREFPAIRQAMAENKMSANRDSP